MTIITEKLNLATPYLNVVQDFLRRQPTTI